MKTILSIVFLIFFASITAQPLDDLLRQAEQGNLGLITLEKEYLSARQIAPQVSQMPNPELGIGVFPLPVETRLGAQISRISATQMLPWFGVLKNKASIENIKAETIKENIKAEKLDLLYLVKINYFKLYELQQTEGIIQQNLVLFESLERLALAKVESGKASAADVLSVQLKTTELKQELKLIETQKTEPLSNINQLLNRPLSTPVLFDNQLEFANLLLNKDSLLAQIRTEHPIILVLNQRQRISNKILLANKLNQKPSFGLGLDYILVNKRTNLELPNNGRDILQLKASMKLPIYRKGYEAKEKEEQLKIQAFETTKTNTYSFFEAAIEKAYAEYENAKLKRTLYEQQILLTQSAINILQTAYSTEGSNFDELLRLEKELIDYDLKMLKAIVQSNIAKCVLEKFISH